MSTWRTFGSSQREGVEDPLERNKKEQEERQRVQAEQQRQKAEAAKKKQPKTTNPLAGVQQALSQDAISPILGTVDGALDRLGFETDLKGIYEERRKESEQNFMGSGKSAQQVQKDFEREAYSNPINAAGSEAIRTVVGAPARLLEGVLDTGALIKDTVSAPFVKDPTKNPFDERYVRAKFDLGIQGPKTPVGKMAEGILTFGIAMRQAAVRLPAGAIGLGTKGKGLKGAIASGLIPGAVADFLLSTPEDGNLSSLVRELVPEESGLQETMLFALAVDTDDNPWLAKLKATVEGGITGAAVDAIGWMAFGRRAAQRALKAGATKEEAVTKGLKAASEAQQAADKASTKKVRDEGNRWSEAQQREMETLLDRERRLMAEEDRLRSTGVEDDDPRMTNLRLEQDETRLTMTQLDNEIVRGYNPEARDLTPFERAANVDTSDVNRVVAQQLQLENGPVPMPARSGALPPRATVNQTVMGGSEHILTDAAYRILNLEDGVEKLVRDTSRKTELLDLARRLGKSDKEVVDQAAQVVQSVRDATRAWNEPYDNVQDLLRDAGALMEVRNATDGTSGEILTREGVVALKALITDTSNQIFELATNADLMIAARQAGGNQFDRMVDRLVTMLGLHKESAVFHGGGLRAFGMDLTGGIRSADPSTGGQLTMKEVKEWASKIKDMARKGDPEAQEEMEALVRAMVLAGGDPSKTVNFMHQAAKLGFKSLMDGMYNSILSGPITHIRNAIGSTYALMERPASLAISGFAKGDEALVRASKAGFHGIVSSVGEAWQVAVTSFRTGDAANLNAKFIFEDAQQLAQIEQLKKAAGTDSEKRAAGFVELLHKFHNNPIINTPSRLLTSADDFFKTLNARQHVQAEAMYKAVSEASSPNDVDGLFNRYLSEMSKKIDPVTGRIVDPDLLQYAEEATFQQNPGTFINNLTNTLNSLPVLRVFVPFIRTPANLLTYAGQHTPGLARFIGDYKKVMQSGDALKIAEYQGREAIGGMVVLAAGLASASGLITGNGPADPRERAVWEKTHAPMSIKIGDSWVSYQSIEPLSTIVSMVADIGQLASMGAVDSAERIAGQLAFSIGAGITDKSYLSGLADIARALDPREMTPNGFTRSLLATSNSFIPFSGARRALSNAIDPYLKEVNGELERAMNSALPGHKLLGSTKVDWLTGEEMASSAGGLYNALSPIRITNKGEDPVKDMLVDIRFEMGDSQKFGPGGVELTAAQRTALAKNMAQSGVYDKLERLRKQDWFKKDVADWKAKGFKWSSDENRPRHYQAVQRIVNDARRSAFNYMMRDTTDPGFAQLVRDARKQKVQYRRGVYQEVETLTNFPN
jgi:hypothetical protein